MIPDKERLREAVESADATLDVIAEAVARPGLERGKARAAIACWMRGGLTPKPKACDLEALANVLNVPMAEIVQFDASHRWARTTARKARLVADMIRDEDIDTALSLLKFNKRRAAVYLRQVLESAIASAEENNADVTKLVVSLSKVDEGPTMKRFQPKDRGRAHPIMKRTSHITVAVVEE